MSTPPAPPVPGVPIAPLNVGLVTQAPGFDIRNGPASAATNIYVRPTIPSWAHWVPVAGLPAHMAITHTGAFVRSAYAQVDTAAVTSLTPSKKRRVAIVLGVSRAVFTYYYRLVDNDMIPGELAPPVYMYDATAGIVLAPNVAAAKVTSAQGMADMTDQERSVAAVLLMSSIGAPVVQGLSLIMVGHHYLSAGNTQSRRAFDAIERQFWSNQAVGSWFTDDIDEVRDASWHKAGHPISVALKEQWAREVRVKEMLVTAGAGSAAARLPAVESILRAGSGYLTLCRTVGPLMESYGGTFDFSILSDAVAEAEAWSSMSITANPAVLPPGVSNSTSKDDALRRLDLVMKNNHGYVAMAYGFYTSLSNTAAMSGAQNMTDTLSNSFALKKLAGLSHATYIQGLESHRDYVAAKNALRSAGQFLPPTITFK